MLGIVAMIGMGAIAACGDDSAAGSDAVRSDSRTAAIVGEGGAPCAESAPDEDAAEQMARACGASVAVESARSEYADVLVDPAGLRTVVASVLPQRAKRLDGTWGAIDTTLLQIDGALVPAATAGGVRFSSGGAGPFATVTSEGHTFTLSWPTPLPSPSVAGDSATYADVVPGVDLVVTATPAGFSHLLVVKTREAASLPAVRRAHYRIGGDAKLASTDDGGLIAEVDATTVVSADAPVMWGAAAIGGGRLTSSADALDAGARIGSVTSAIVAEDLVLSPDAAMLDDPETKFPLTIDPLFITGQNQWAYASADNQNGPTNDNHVEPGDPSPSATEMRIGNDPDTTHQYRGFLRFPIASVAGKQILAVKIAGRVDHTYLCGANRPTYFYRSAAITATPRQTWPGPALQRLVGNNNVHANETSCGEPNVPFEVASATLVNDVQTAASARAASYYVALSAGENTAGLNETNQERWMRYFVADFKLHITYNTKPNKPDRLTVDAKACATGANRPFIKTTTPTLRAHVVDPDGDTLDVAFAWARWNGTAWVDQPGGGHQSRVPNNGTAQFNATGNVDGGIYTFRVQSNDSPSHSPSLVSDVTAMPGNCEWQVDITPPAVPTVTSDIYLEGPTACPGGACGSVGQTGRFVFSSSPDTKSFLWGWSDPPTTPLTPAALGGSVAIDFTPVSSGPRTLFVRAIDRAGNERTRAYQFVVAAESTARARWLLDDGAGGSLDDDTGNGNSATISGGSLGAPGRIAPGADGASRTALQLDGTPGGGATTAGPVIADTSKSFSIAAWVKLDDNAVSHRAVEQIGATASAFVLEFDKASGAWKITAPSADGTATPGATSTSIPRLHAWTHLAGTYDSASKELKLYVNGVLERTATAITTWNATGALRIGYSWAGSLAEIQAWDRVVSAAEVFELSDPIEVGRVGEWHMDEVGPGPAFDASGLIHDLSFVNGAIVPPSGAGQSGTGLQLDGVNDYAATDTQVVHTDQSFTVSVWARPTSATVEQTFVSQQSAGVHGGFSLGLSPGATPVWRFRMHTSSGATAGVTSAAAPATSPTTAFHHLVGVFDAQRQEIRLYIDGALKTTTAMIAGWQPWDAAGPLLLGRDHNGAAGSEFTGGSLDEVRIYQGVVADVTRIR
jgi:hypothetical protein